jgi:cytidylate kinase
VTEYWVSKSVVIDWRLTNPETGAFVPGATVVGTVTRPDATTDTMVVTETADAYRAAYDPAVAGLHAYRLVATGTADSAEEGTFVVRAPLVGAAPVTTDPTTPVGMVRLLISDTSEADPVFSDAEVAAFLAMESANLRMAAAQALDTIASNEVMVSKVIRTQDLQTDGSKVAAELRARATSLREQAAATDDTGAVFGLEIVDFDPTGWALSGNGL